MKSGEKRYIKAAGSIIMGNLGMDTAAYILILVTYISVIYFFLSMDPIFTRKTVIKIFMLLVFLK